MTSPLFPVYRKVYEQCFMPIFGQDGFDTETLLEACGLAKLQVIEYTLRREDAREVIPSLKKRFPDAVILVGSIIDSETVTKQMKKKHPQLMTVSELAPFSDGFVSMLPFSDKTLESYAKTHLLIPNAQTGGEALHQIEKGAAFIKVLGPDFFFSKQLHAAPTFNYCPTYITGGVSRDRMEEAFSCGNVLCAAGFDVILKDLNPKDATPQNIADRIVSFVEKAKKERAKHFPALCGIEALSDEEFLSVLPNFCSVE